jgi:hypothetical protein
MRKRAVSLAFMLLTAVFAFSQPDAQQQPPSGMGGGMRGRQGVIGTITEITKNGLTVKTVHGDTATVKVSSDTRFRRDRADSKLSDFKVGEVVMVGGEQDKNGVWNARVVAMRSDFDGGEMRGGRFGADRPNPTDLGKTFVVGQLTNIEDTKLTIHRPDGVDQVVEVDENTSFRNARGESITLPDFKVGDRIGGRGAIKNGTFVASEFRQVPAHMERGMGQGGPASRGMRPNQDGSVPPAPPDNNSPKE